MGGGGDREVLVKGVVILVVDNMVVVSVVGAEVAIEDVVVVMVLEGVVEVVVEGVVVLVVLEMVVEGVVECVVEVWW